MSVFPFPPCHLQLSAFLGEAKQEVSAWIVRLCAVTTERQGKVKYKFNNWDEKSRKYSIN